MVPEVAVRSEVRDPGGAELTAENHAVFAVGLRNGRVEARSAIGEQAVTLVLGGDCTVGIGTVAGHVAGNERVGLIYVDAHADLNVPDTA